MELEEKILGAIKKIENSAEPMHPFELFGIEHGYGWYGLTLPIVEEIRRYNKLQAMVLRPLAPHVLLLRRRTETRLPVFVRGHDPDGRYRIILPRGGKICLKKNFWIT